MAETAPAPDTGGTSPEATPAPEAAPSSPAENAPRTDDAATDGGAPATDASTDGPDATLAEDGGGEDAPAASPADFPDDWRDKMAGDNEKLSQLLKRYTSPAAVANALLSANQKIGSGDLGEGAAKPEGDPTDPKVKEALDAWRESKGLPPEPAGYLDMLDDGIVVGDDDMPNVETFLQDMHEQDAPPSNVNAALNWYYRTVEAAQAQQSERDREVRAKTEDDLRAEWGNEYRPYINGANNMLDAYVPAEFKNQLFTARLSDGSLLGNNPDFLRMLVNFNQEVNPTGTVTPRSGETPLQTTQSRLGEIREMMRDMQSEYYRGAKAEALQAEYRELLDQEERFAKRAGNG